MKTYSDEIAGAREYAEESKVPGFTEAQLSQWRAQAQSLQAWTLAHSLIHDALNVALFLGFLTADVGSVWLVSKSIGFTTATQLRFWLGAAGLALVHGWLLYSITSVSLHEGAGHGRLVLGRSRAAGVLRSLLNHSCRLGFADPAYYRTRHPSHHARLGSEQDGAFTHLVRPTRVLLSLLPLAAVLPFNDYRIHSGGPYTRSRALSDLIGTGFVCLTVGIALRFTSLGWAVLVLVVLSPWVAFVLDRLRETVDHALLPTDSVTAARSLGFGGWGFWLAPGPWGQCAHLVHHLFPGLPWYQQARLHRWVARTLSETQRRHYLLAPGLGLPRLLLQLLREGRRRTCSTHEAPGREVTRVA